MASVKVRAVTWKSTIHSLVTSHVPFPCTSGGFMASVKVRAVTWKSTIHSLVTFNFPFHCTSGGIEVASVEIRAVTWKPSVLIHSFLMPHLVAY
jgi:hypothetical protein